MNPSPDGKAADENAPESPTPEPTAAGNNVNVQQQPTASSQTTEPTQDHVEHEATASSTASRNPSNEKPALATGDYANVAPTTSEPNPQGQAQHQRTGSSTAPRKPSNEKPAGSSAVQVQEDGSPQCSSPGVQQVRPPAQGTSANQREASKLKRTRDDDSDDEGNELREVLTGPAVDRSVRDVSRGLSLLNALYNNAWMILFWSGERLLWFIASLLYWPFNFLARRRR